MRSLMITRSRASLAGALLVTLSLTVLRDRHASSTAAQGPASCVAPPSGLVSWWPGDGSANDFRDGNPGTLINGATFAPGKVGLGFSLDGVDDRVEIPDAANLKPANVTVETWVKFDALDTPGASLPGLQYIVFKRNSRTSFFEGYALVKIRVGGVDRLRFVIASASGVQVVAASTTAVAAGQFYHVAGSYDGTTAKLYVNGVLEDQQAANFPLDYGPRPVFIGSSEEGHNGRLKGVVDEASIYNRALTAAEIQAIFAADNAGKCKPACVAPPSGMVSWWPGDGHAVDIQDGNHGTLVNGVTFATSVVGQGFNLDGIDDYVSTNLDVQPSAMPVTTWDAWVFPTRANYGIRQQIFSSDDGEADRSVLIEANTANFGIFMGYEVWQPVGVTLNQWQHIAVVYTATNVEFYKNGVRYSRGAGPIFRASVNKFNIGRNPGFGEFFQGRIDEVEVFNRALTQSEIQAIYNAGSAGKCKPSGVQFDGRGSFLHTAAGDVPTAPPAIVDLGALGFAPGDSIRLSFTVQNFSFVSCSGPFNVPGVHAVFSNSNTLLAPSNFARVPGAIEAGNDIVTPPTGLGNEPTDIPQDFQVFLTNGPPIQIPLGATHLFIGVIDTLYYDNCGKVIMTIERIAADLEITQSVSPDPVTTGSDLTYQLVVKNNGPSAATSVTVADNLPASTTFVSCAATGSGVCGGSGNNRTVTFSSLASGASATITLVAKVNCSVANDTMIGNTATVSSATSDTNSSNNSTTATVTASNPKPSITAPPAVSVTADTTQCGKTVDDATLGTATASDNCPGVTITRSGVPANNFFTVGTTTIIYTATDAGGNTATASQTVTVSDNTLPTITAPAPITVATGAGATACGVTISDATLGTATASDNCGSTTITRSGVPAGNLFPVGTTMITYTATDLFGNVATATQTVTVTDNTVPTITAPAALSLATGAGATACGLVISDATLGSAAASDNCGSGLTVNRSGVPTGNLFPVGTTTITYTATDASGNTATATQTITVTDNTAPTITAPPAVTANTGAGATACGVVISDAALGTATASDNCGSATITRSGVPAGNTFPVGTTTITYTATDSAGNVATATQTVTVTDNTAPTITAPPAVNANADAGSCAATGVALGAPTTGDNCGVASATNNAPSSFPLGLTTVTWTITDVNGNTATATQTVIVTDNQKPSITAPAALNVATGAGATSCGVVISDAALGQATATDNCGTANITRSGVPAGNLFPVGTTTISYTADDGHGNTATTTQTVTVSDNTPPALTAPSNVSAATGPGATTCGVVISDAALGTATASDNCSVTITRAGVPAGNVFPVGVTTITYTATDPSGNTTTATQTVTVADNTPPAITACATNKLLSANAGCQASIPNLIGEVAAADNCTASAALLITQIPAAGTLVGPGATTVTITVKDAAGNMSTCAATVTVADTTPPAITACATNKTVAANGANQGAIPNLTGEVAASDNCTPSAGLMITQSPAAGTMVGLGNTTVTLTVKDAAGNQSTCSAVVSVIAPVWITTANLNTARAGHTATLLQNGNALVVGGANASNNPLASVELYNPATGTWSATGSLSKARVFHTATLLPNGKVLVAGGLGPTGSLNSAELYDPVTGTWSTTGNLGAARSGHTATLLASGKVLVTGGANNNNLALKSAELYDPATGMWSAAGNLTAGRTAHTATLLLNGQVLVAGGEGASGRLASAELYNPATGAWSLTGNLPGARATHTATLLASGKVLVAGGLGAFGSLTSAALYDPAVGTWLATGNLNAGRAAHTATLLPNGKVLVAGGANLGNLALKSAELYDPVSGSWSVTGSFNVGRTAHTATLLGNGRVLAAGGRGSNSTLNSAELYGPL